MSKVTEEPVFLVRELSLVYLPILVDGTILKNFHFSTLVYGISSISNIVVSISRAISARRDRNEFGRGKVFVRES